MMEKERGGGKGVFGVWGLWLGRDITLGWFDDTQDLVNE